MNTDCIELAALLFVWVIDTVQLTNMMSIVTSD